MRGMKGQTGLR